MGLLTGTFDPAAVVVSFNGHRMVGFADGTFIKSSREEPVYAKKVGAGGEVARTRSANKSGSSELTLLQTSASNDVLSELVVADEASGTGVGEFMVQDLNGATLAHSVNSWITGYPDVESGKEVGDRTWKFEHADLELFVGGNKP